MSDDVYLPVYKNRSGVKAVLFEGNLYLEDGRAFEFAGREGAWKEDEDLDVSDFPKLVEFVTPRVRAALEAAAKAEEIRLGREKDEAEARAARIAYAKSREGILAIKRDRAFARDLRRLSKLLRLLIGE